MLVGAGFNVIEASDGKEAVAAYQARSGDISLVVLDQTMPEMNGWEAFTRIRAVSEGVPVVFMSGYTDAMGDAAPDPRTVFVHKPFRAATLTAKVREAMGA